MLHCPADKQRGSALNFEVLANGNVSYWIHPAARFGDTDSPVAGDRNVRTSGRNGWTHLQVGPTDRVEFSAELHGHRGNVLFADGHVALLDAAALRSAFAATNATDTVLSLPAADSVVPGASTTPASNQSSSPTGLAQVSQGANSRQNAAESAAADTTASAGGTATNRSLPPPPASASMRRESPGGSNKLDSLVITRLDGTTVTSSIPVFSDRETLDASMREEAADPPHPLLNFVHWLTALSARGTYWLILLLLLAMVALEFARRRARRKRKGI